MSSEMVARLRSAMLTVDDMGIGQARIQRSQPMHISISKRICSSVRGCKFVRCSMPTTSGCFFEDDICMVRTFLPFARGLLVCLRCATACTEACNANVQRTTPAAGVRLCYLDIGRGCFCLLFFKGTLLDKVEHDAADGDAIAVREAIGTIDTGTVHHHAVAAVKVANVDAIGTVEDLGVQARGGYFGQHNVILLVSS